MGTTASSAYVEVIVESVCDLLWIGSMFLARRFERVTADVWAGSVLKGRGGRNGIATANLEARKRVK